mmetsp:Transcript_723/g.1482  ORF Transcript_723/g.1482 Transcript_723/m.1482 type:complete len:111 (+) Transcript_723:993-1325(+)
MSLLTPVATRKCSQTGRIRGELEVLRNPIHRRVCNHCIQVILTEISSMRQRSLSSITIKYPSLKVLVTVVTNVHLTVQIEVPLGHYSPPTTKVVSILIIIHANILNQIHQ